MAISDVLNNYEGVMFKTIATNNFIKYKNIFLENNINHPYNYEFMTIQH